ncbi:hypothetical protein MTO96_007076 [Rhipicephalus appendiculatus]
MKLTKEPTSVRTRSGEVPQRQRSAKAIHRVQQDSTCHCAYGSPLSRYDASEDRVERSTASVCDTAFIATTGDVFRATLARTCYEAGERLQSSGFVPR